MKVSRSINEVVQWGLIIALIMMAFNFDVDFFTTAPKRVTDLESRQNTQEQRIQLLEQRVSELESTVREIEDDKSASEFNKEIETLRFEIKQMASSEDLLPNSQFTTTSNDVSATPQEGTAPARWYMQRYVWLGAAVVVLLAFLAIQTKKRRTKKNLSVIHNASHVRSNEKDRDCA